MAYGKTGEKALSTAERRAFVLTLRRRGWIYARIVRAAIEQFGIDKLPKGWDERYAYKDVKRELDYIRNQIGEDASAVLTLELNRLDVMFEAMYKQARKGNQGAIDRVLRIMERRAKLLGLDAPQRHDVAASGITIYLPNKEEQVTDVE